MRRLGCLIALVSMGCVASGCGTNGGSGDMGAGSDGGVDDLAGGGGGPEDLATADLLPPPSPWVYVSGNSATISRFRLDLATGALTAMGTTTSTGQTSYLAIDPARGHLFAVDEQNSKVEAFTIDAATGALTHVGTDRGSGGTGPAHLSVDATGKWVLTANYGSGDVAVLAVAADGTLGAPMVLGPAPPGMMAHQILLDATNKFAWVPCLGSNHIAQLTFNATTGALAANTPVNVNTATGGPRHVALTPNGKHAYLIEENASMMSGYSVDAAGNLTPLAQRISTRVPNPTGNNTGAEVQVHPSGKFLYGSNRGDDDIVLYTLAADGTMTYVANKKTGGQTPRHFSIDATGKWLLVGNQASNDVRVFAIGSDGTLTATGAPKTVTSPTFVGIVTL